MRTLALLFIKCLETACSNWDLNVLADVQLLVSAKIHWLVEERNNVWVKGEPVGVLKVVFLGLRTRNRQQSP